MDTNRITGLNLSAILNFSRAKLEWEGSSWKKGVDVGEAFMSFVINSVHSRQAFA